jgi:hypothetical protein
MPVHLLYHQSLPATKLCECGIERQRSFFERWNRKKLTGKYNRQKNGSMELFFDLEEVER